MATTASARRSRATTSTPDLPPEIEDLSDTKESMNFLVYGDSGAGKTVLGSKLPNLLIVVAEDGVVSAKRAGASAKVWRIHEWNDMVKVFEYLQAGQHPFEWVMIDSLTNLQQRCIRDILKDGMSKNPTRDPHIPQLQDYFKWQLKIKEMVSDINELPINVLWTAQAMVRENQEGDDIVLPLVEGKDYQIASWVCAQMDLVAYLGLRKVKVRGSDEAKVVRQLVTGDSELYRAKDRYGVLAKTINNPDINKIVSEIKSSETQEEKPVAARRRARKTAQGRN